MTAPRPVRVTIDRLVLHGIDRADAAAVQRALATELQAALAASGPLAPARESIRLDLGPTGDSGSLGRSAGRALGDALTGKGPPR